MNSEPKKGPPLREDIEELNIEAALEAIDTVDPIEELADAYNLDVTCDVNTCERINYAE